MEKLQQIREDARAEIGETLEQMNEEISAILTEGQKQTWQGQLDPLQQELRPGGWRRGMGGGRAHRGDEVGGPRPGRGPQPPFRRGPGPFGPPRPPAGPNFPRNDVNQDTTTENEKPANEQL